MLRDILRVIKTRMVVMHLFVNVIKMKCLKKSFIDRLILCRSFHKLKTMVKFYKEFIFVIIQRINRQISTFCHICDRKREYDVILMYTTGLHVIVFSAFRNLKSTSCKTHHSHTVYQNNIKFSFLMTNMTKC